MASNLNNTHPETQSVGEQQLLSFLTDAEGDLAQPYGDGRGLSTVGVGFNLTAATTRGYVLQQLGIGASIITAEIPGLSQSQSSTIAAQENSYVTQLINVINQAWSTTPVGKFGPTNDLPHNQQLNAILSARASYYQGLANQGINTSNVAVPTTFSLSVAQINNVYSALIRPVEQQINMTFAGLQTSNEWVALLSLQYNGGNLIGAQLTADMAAGSRSEAWYEIRYDSNGGNTSSVGVAGRRYAESQLFDLYGADFDPAGTGNADLGSKSDAASTAATSIYQMYTHHRDAIIAYDTIAWPGALQNANTRFSDVVQSQSWSQAFAPAYNYLVTNFAQGIAAPAETNIWAAPFDTAAGQSAPDLSWSQSQFGPGNVMIIGGQGRYTGGLWSVQDAPVGALILVGDGGAGGTDVLNQLGSLDQGLWSAAKFNGGYFEANLVAPNSSSSAQNLAIDLANDVLAIGGAGFPVLENQLRAASSTSATLVSFTFGGSSGSAAVGSSTSWQVSGYGPAEVQVKFNSAAGLTLVGGASPGVVVQNSLTNVPSVTPNIAPSATSLIIGASAGGDNVTDAALSGSHVLVAQGDGNTLVATHSGDVLVADGNNNFFEDMTSGAGTGGGGSSPSNNGSVVMLGGNVDGAVSVNDTFTAGSSEDIMIGSSGTNDFKINSDPKNPNSVIIWGGGGTSTYDFANITGSPIALNGYTVVVLNIKDPTIDKLTKINPQDILRQYTPQIKSITEVDAGLSNKNIIVLINPGANDVIKYDGNSIAVAPNLSVPIPFGLPGYINKADASKYDFIDSIPGAPFNKYQNTAVFGSYTDSGLISYISLSNIAPGEFDNPGSGSSASTGPSPSVDYGSGTDTIVAGTGFQTGSGDTLIGEGGNVTYSVAAFDGAVTIDNSIGTDTNHTVLAFDATIAPTQVAVTSSSDGFILTDATAGTSVLIQNASQNPSANVSAVTFADGTVWTEASLLAMADTPSAANTSLYGDAGANVLDSQGVATYEQGNGGGDTFVYKPGYGTLAINEAEPNGATNILAFGAGITAAQLEVSGGVSGDLILTDGTAGDRIQLDGMLTNPNGGVQLATFANGTSLTGQQLIALELTPSIGNTSLYGTSGDDVLDSRGVATYEQGNGGNDSFIYDQGDGDLIIDETETGTASSTISFGPGITTSDLTVSGGANGALLLGDGTSGDSITLTGMLTNSQMGVQQVTFSDGTSLTAAQLIAAEMQPSASNKTIYGTPDPDTLDSEGIATYEDGEGGGDIFLYKSGYGQLEINEQEPGSATNILSFGAGITAAQLQVTADASGDLIPGLTGSDLWPNRVVRWT